MTVTKVVEIIRFAKKSKFGKEEIGYRVGLYNLLTKTFSETKETKFLTAAKVAAEDLVLYGFTFPVELKDKIAIWEGRENYSKGGANSADELDPLWEEGVSN